VASALLLGELACLGAALCWAISVALFRKPIAREGAVTVNFGKNTIAAVLFGSTAAVLGQLAGFTELPPAAIGALVLSGLLGLTLGDSALFLAVGSLGAHRALLFQTLAPIFAALCSWLLAGELLTALQAAGVALVLAGVTVVVAPAKGEARQPLAWVGIAWATTAAFGQGAGIALTKTAMATVPVFAASFIRQGSAVLGLVLVLALQKKLRHSLGLFTAGNRFLPILFPAVLSAYIGFSLMMLGIARAPASVAAVLLAVTPVFSLFLDAATGHGKLTWRGLLGTAVAVAGVAVLVAT
jgi:drug/metabolite transporter (DMT)-like permease